jgi:hypothetical protein
MLQILVSNYPSTNDVESRMLYILCKTKPEYAIKTNDVYMLKRCIEISGSKCRTNYWTLAAMYGNLDIMKWLLDNTARGYTNGHVSFDTAAEYGHLHILKWLHGLDMCFGVRASRHAMDWASMNGHLEVIKWLHENRTEGCTTDAIDNAAMNGHLDVIKWLHANRTEGYTDSAIESSVENGHVEVVKWFHANGMIDGTKKLARLACVNGRLEILKWIYDPLETSFIHPDIVDLSISKCHFNIVIWLHSVGINIHPKRALRFACSEGCLDMVKWICDTFVIPNMEITQSYELALSRRRMDIVSFIKMSYSIISKR